MNPIHMLLLTLLTPILTSSMAQTPDWRSWRGPSADGTASGTNWSMEKVRNGSAILWKTNVGTGHSAVAINGNRLCTIGNWEIAPGDFIDRVVCLDAGNGRILWKYDYAMQEGEDPGPFSTPVTDETRLYTLSRGGHLHCFDAADGTLLWKRNLVTEGAVHEEAEFACSPVLTGNLLILNINKSGLALDKLTGKSVWTSDTDKNALSTAVRFRNGGKEYITMQTNDETYALEPLTGKVVWTIPEGYIPDPLFLDGTMIIFSYKGISRYDLTKNPPERIWSNPSLKSRFQSFVHHNGYVYGWINMGGDKLVCLDLGTGNIKWSEKISAGSLILANSTLIVIDKEGMLRFIEASPAGFHQLSGMQAVNMAPTDVKGRDYRRESACWTNPVLCNQKIYVRSTYGELVCVDVSP